MIIQQKIEPKQKHGSHWHENGGNPHSPQSPYYFLWERDNYCSITNEFKRIFLGRCR